MRWVGIRVVSLLPLWFYSGEAALLSTEQLWCKRSFDLLNLQTDWAWWFLNSWFESFLVGLSGVHFFTVKGAIS